MGSPVQAVTVAAQSDRIEDRVCASAEITQFRYGLASSSVKTRITLLTYQLVVASAKKIKVWSHEVLIHSAEGAVLLKKIKRQVNRNSGKDQSTLFGCAGRDDMQRKTASMSHLADSQTSL